MILRFSEFCNSKKKFFSGSVAATLVVRSMAVPVVLAPVALPPVVPPFVAPKARECTDVAETCSRFRSLVSARAYCDELENNDDETFVGCSVRGVGASRSNANGELEAVGGDGRAMAQLQEVRSYDPDPESWQACVRAGLRLSKLRACACVRVCL